MREKYFLCHSIIYVLFLLNSFEILLSSRLEICQTVRFVRSSILKCEPNIANCCESSSMPSISSSIGSSPCTFFFFTLLGSAGCKYGLQEYFVKEKFFYLFTKSSSVKSFSALHLEVQTLISLAWLISSTALSSRLSAIYEIERCLFKSEAAFAASLFASPITLFLF